MPLPCVACAAVEATKEAREQGAVVRADTPFLNALVMLERLGRERVEQSLCVSHRDHLREYRKIAVTGTDDG